MNMCVLRMNRAKCDNRAHEPNLDGVLASNTQLIPAR